MEKALMSRLLSQSYRFLKSRRLSTKYLDVQPEIQDGLATGKPVVALESTIITHGMPYPHNLQTALEVERIVRSKGAIPATVAILQGRVKVGLAEKDLKYLARPETAVIKSSRRDIPFVLSKSLNGGTTVSGTLLVCSLVGIKIFVTGGIGGVHRDGHVTLDVSADLNELGRHSIAVISSGIKSILDIGRTLEYLETHGVCVATFGETNDFPAFYTRSSGYKSQYHVNNVQDAAKLIKSLVDMDTKSGLLLGVPVPEKFELIKSAEMEKIIQSALALAEEKGVKGKEVTPFLLNEIKQITEGKSLETNIALIKNNALVGSQIAVELSKLNKIFSNKPPSRPITTNSVSVGENESGVLSPSQSSENSSKQIVVIGASIMDFTVKADEDIQLDGRTLMGKVQQSSGGVGRNLADAIGRLVDVPPILISAVGDDVFGDKLLADLPHVNTNALFKSEYDTACMNVLLDKFGECLFLIAAMDINKEITSQKIVLYEDVIKNSRMVVFDGNLPPDSIQTLLQICDEYKIPVWFEPTDITMAHRPFKTKLPKSITFASPNLFELFEISKVLNEGIDLNLKKMAFSLEDAIRLAVRHGLPLLRFIPNIMVTLGINGVLMLSRSTDDDLKNAKIHHYKAPLVSKLVNVSGAGDCLAAGYISGLIRGLSESQAMAAGLHAATLALQSQRAVPNSLKWVHVEAAPYTTFQPKDFDFTGLTF